MRAPTPNPQQQALIDQTDGVYLVDAGAGTGKTFTITRRYASIIDQEGIEPEDVLLGTFTRSAATEMKERIVDHSSYGLETLSDAPIQTFHSLCHDLLREHGFRAPTHLGIDDRITGSTNLLEDELVENALFREFVGQFRDSHPEHADLFRVLDDPSELLGLLTQLAAKGVIATADGWYRNSDSHLEGEFETFREQFTEVNEPRNEGSKQSALREKLSRFGRDKHYRPDAPSKTELRGERGTKQLDASVAETVFDEDRTALKSFVHDLYIEYLEFALTRNYLNFSFLQLFTFVLLCEDHDLRDEIGFEYVMVDEFQDTSEIQFKLTLLLCADENLCVVGDWKQSIYSFQYADVENITEFADRIDRYRGMLNDDADRVAVGTADIVPIRLTENYRSTQTILDFSMEALEAPATATETVGPPDPAVEPLASNAPFDRTCLEAIQHEEEHEALLSKIQEIVGNDVYAVEDEDGEPRAPRYDDIAVLTRTRSYGRELLAVAEEYEVPMAYDGGVELFRTDAAKLVLAWLRILDTDADRGWAVVLEEAGYGLDEIDRLLSSEGYPAEMRRFRRELQVMESVGSIVRSVLEQYEVDSAVADALVHTLQSVHDSTTHTRGDLIQFIERAIENGATYDVHSSAGENSITVQTIHAAKGQEYPIVILANMNDGQFPPSGGRGADIQYTEPIGLRQRTKYGVVEGDPHIYDNWRYDVLRRCVPENYDEERRLLYVACTRARHHLVFAAGSEPNTFLTELPVDCEHHEPTIEPVAADESTQTQLPFRISPPDGPRGETPHSIMDDSVFDTERRGESDASRGTSFGSKVHEFAEAYARGDDVHPESNHEERVMELIDGLSGALFVEEPALLPLKVDGQSVTISGTVDLVHVTPAAVEILDFKTDTTRRAQSEYRKQLSVYYHVLAAEYENRSVTASLFYTADGSRESIEPLSIEDLTDLLRS